jgi:hypothetical protein
MRVFYARGVRTAFHFAAMVCEVHHRAAFCVICILLMGKKRPTTPGAAALDLLVLIVFVPLNGSGARVFLPPKKRPNANTELVEKSIPCSADGHVDRCPI